MAAYRLSTSVPYLLNRAAVRFDSAFAAHIAGSGLTLSMFWVLAALLEVTDQNLSDLAAMTSIDISTLSRLVGTLVKKGLVTRTRVPDDVRTVRINLSRRGVGAAGRLLREAQRSEAALLAGFTRGALRRFKGDLVKVNDGLDLWERGAAKRKSPHGTRAERASLRAGWRPQR